MSSGNTSADPWAWLGLLKWSLSYSDGTHASNVQALSPEDKAFLEAVMKEGIIDENERMKEILREVTNIFENWRTSADRSCSDKDTVEMLLQELRDIVEQIDYARAFAAMKGLGFLLGSVQEQSIPQSTRSNCFGIIATMCQHNPPVQKELLEMGSLKIFSDLFFQDDGQVNLRPKILQAMSANVRSHDLAEAVLCELPQSIEIFRLGLRQPETIQRTLFFLHALVTSDSADSNRIQKYSEIVAFVMDQFLLQDAPQSEITELALSMITQLLEQNKNIDEIRLRKNVLISKSIQRVADLHKLSGQEKEYAQMELDLWENLLLLLSRL
jgi:hsp70-interacting protein